jgi:hypothetical protein
VNATRPLLSLGLDLDNLWAYMKIHGDAGWDQYPSYLDILSPLVVDIMRQHQLRMTVFIVGQDAALERNGPALAALSAAGHEMGNHSFRHEPWFHLYSKSEIETEIRTAEEAIEKATGRRPVGFRNSRGMSAEEKEKRSKLYGTLSDGFQPIRPYTWSVDGRPLVELPVTTMPGLRVPFHLSYVLYLRRFSRALAWTYFRTSLALCRMTGISPSYLLHPLDLLGGDRVKELAFFPGMDLSTGVKIEFLHEVLDALRTSFKIVTLEEHARAVAARPVTAVRRVGEELALG